MTRHTLYSAGAHDELRALIAWLGDRIAEVEWLAREEGGLKVRFVFRERAV